MCKRCPLYLESKRFGEQALQRALVRGWFAIQIRFTTSALFPLSLNLIFSGSLVFALFFVAFSDDLQTDAIVSSGCQWQFNLLNCTFQGASS